MFYNSIEICTHLWICSATTHQLVYLKPECSTLLIHRHNPKYTYQSCRSKWKSSVLVLHSLDLKFWWNPIKKEISNPHNWASGWTFPKNQANSQPKEWDVRVRGFGCNQIHIQIQAKYLVSMPIIPNNRTLTASSLVFSPRKLMSLHLCFSTTQPNDDRSVWDSEQCQRDWEHKTRLSLKMKDLISTICLKKILLHNFGQKFTWRTLLCFISAVLNYDMRYSGRSCHSVKVLSFCIIPTVLQVMVPLRICWTGKNKCRTEVVLGKGA